MAENKIKNQKSKVKKIVQKSKVTEEKVVTRTKAVKKETAVKKPQAKKLVEAEFKIDTKNKEKKKIAHLKADVVDTEGAVIENIELPQEVFGQKKNDLLLAQAVRVYLANQREGSAATKTRGEVRGSTRKIYRQKGTGRARHGAIRAPIFVGGGIVFGPKPRDYSMKMSKQMRRKALFVALSQKFDNKNLTIIDGLSKLKPKTREFAKVVVNLNLADTKKKADKVLFIVSNESVNVKRAARNIEGLNVRNPGAINTYEIINSKHILLTKESIDIISKTFLK